MTKVSADLLTKNLKILILLTIGQYLVVKKYIHEKTVVMTKTSMIRRSYSSEPESADSDNYMESHMIDLMGSVTKGVVSVLIKIQSQ